MSAKKKLPIVQRVLQLLRMFLSKKKFVFRFDVYDGTEESNEIYVENVYEYEFINQGTTIVVLNSGLPIYPEFSGIAPSRVKLSVNYNEKDETIYKYEFLPLDYIAIVDPSANWLVGGYAGNVDAPFIASVAQFKYAPPAGRLVNFNKLVVISKEIFVAETMSKEN